MKSYTAAERAALIEWLTPQIHELETACDEIPFGLDEGDAMQLKIMRIALASLTAKPVGYVSKNSRELAKAGHLGYISNHIVAGLEGGYVYDVPPAAALVLPKVGSNVVNEAAWLLHDKLAEGGPLTGHQFNNLKGSFYEAMKIALAAPAEGGK